MVKQAKKALRKPRPGPAPPAFKYKLSSGLFALPAAAQSVDWALVNDSGTTQSVRVTVYQGGVGVAKTVVPPGPLSLSLNANFVTHNANSVGVGQPFQIGNYYEVILETKDLRVLPCVMVWENHAGTAIAGTLIAAGDFVDVS
jgi:hypothetical protein